jgi:hypothetical protein
VISLLVHCYLDEGKTPRHIYQDGAELLRPDWSFKSEVVGVGGIMDIAVLLKKA